MTSRERPPTGKALGRPSSASAQARLAAALRENLKRRKTQERARDDNDEAPPPSDKDGSS